MRQLADEKKCSPQKFSLSYLYRVKFWFIIVFVILASVIISYSVTYLNYYLKPDDNLTELIRTSQQGVQAFFEGVFSSHPQLADIKRDIQEISEKKFSFSVNEKGEIEPFSPYHMTLTLAAQDSEGVIHPKKAEYYQGVLAKVFSKIKLIPNSLRVDMGKFMAIVFKKEYELRDLDKPLTYEEKAALKLTDEFNPKVPSAPHISIAKWGTNAQKKKKAAATVLAEQEDTENAEEPVAAAAAAPTIDLEDADEEDDGNTTDGAAGAAQQQSKVNPWIEMQEAIDRMNRDIQATPDFSMTSEQLKLKLGEIFNTIVKNRGSYVFPSFQIKDKIINLENIEFGAFFRLFVQNGRLNKENFHAFARALLSKDKELKPFLEGLPQLAIEVSALMQGFSYPRLTDQKTLPKAVIWNGQEIEAERREEILEKNFPEILKKVKTRQESASKQKEAEADEKQKKIKSLQAAITTFIANFMKETGVDPALIEKLIKAGQAGLRTDFIPAEEARPINEDIGTILTFKKNSLNIEKATEAYERLKTIFFPQDPEGSLFKKYNPKKKTSASDDDDDANKLEDLFNEY